VLARVRSGEFFREFLADHAAGGARLRQMHEKSRRARLEEAGERRRGRGDGE